MTTRTDKIKGGLIGGAIGDAFGYPFEFDTEFNAKDVKQLFLQR